MRYLLLLFALLLQVGAVASACSPTTPVGQVCGSSAGTLATTTVPAAPASVVTVTVVV